MAKQLPVVAAIPNYNMAVGLKRLLPQVLAQFYDAVYVLDDASTDKSRATVQEFGDRVQFVAGEVNRCSAGNRNRILDAVKDNAIIHFLDADTELASDDVPEQLRELFQKTNIGFIGGLVQDPQGRQSSWNYGPLFGIWNTVTGNLQWRARDRQTKLSKVIERIGQPLIHDWPNPSAEPRRRQVGWVLEANMAITRDTFAKLGGFDPNVRDHDIVDLSIKAAKRGLKSYFDPRFAVIQHNDILVRNDNRQIAKRQATRYLIKKYGLRYWLTPK